MEDVEDTKANIAIKSEIKSEPLGYDLDDVHSASVTEFTSTLTSVKFIKGELEENEEVEKIDIKCESLDYEPQRPIIENASEYIEKQFECHKCSYKSRNKSLLRKHFLFMHEKEKAPRYACELCFYETIRKQDLNKHIRHIHEKKEIEFECVECQFKSRYKRSLYLHMKRTHTKVTLECTICQRSFKRKEYLDAHYISAHRDQRNSFNHLLTCKVYQCSKCSYAGVNAATFRDHLLTHRDDQSKFKFECFTCGYKCVRKSSLVLHVRTHADTDQLPFACSECNKRFSLKQHLDGHIVSRHKENEELMKTVTHKVYQCLKCSLKTVRITDIKKHVNRCNNK